MLITALLTALALAATPSHPSEPDGVVTTAPATTVILDGAGGYRDYAAAVSLPIGESGRLDISVRQVENGYP